MNDLDINNLLTSIEKQEAKFLNWGIVNVHFNKDEVISIIDEWINKEDKFEYDSEILFDSLLQKKLLVQINSEDKYRTRIAEAMFYISNLKQIMPYHFEEHEYNAWKVGKNLVYDFRFNVRSRFFPFERTSFIDYIDKIANENNIDIVKSLLEITEGNYFELFPFQVRSSESILNSINTKLSEKKATIITAGTGAGKTLAYYIPSIISISQSITEEHSTKAIAFYPRNALLEDQYEEAAEWFSKVNNAHKMKKNSLKRKLRIGHMYGSTPDYVIENGKVNLKKTINDQLLKKGWEPYQDANYFVSPLLTCKNLKNNENFGDFCGGKLLWNIKDIENRIEKLTCWMCEAKTDPTVFPLTRTSIKNDPPDLLFLGMELLNRRLSDKSYHKLFGIGTDKENKVQSVLLDEIHTYTGISGLNIKYVLNRWKHLAFDTTEDFPYFVGLSATLNNPIEHISKICSIEEKYIEHVEPYLKEMTEEAGEYHTIIKSDPISRTSTLSTTIQTLMLVQRMLDEKSQVKDLSKGIYGSKTWVFTDDLDVTNRLDDSLYDAEKNYLFSYRNKDHVSDEGYLNGQRWDFASELGWDMSKNGSLNIAKVSSQNKKLDDKAQIVVTTESLTVGVSDKFVGAVVQHKAPRNSSSFIQRKGRAGRTRIMRPWSIIVLSDFGRDRISYQNWDSLVNPVIDTNTLPENNFYVMKIQATLALLDFISLKLDPNLRKKNIFFWLSQPIEEDASDDLFEKVIELLDKIINGEISNELFDHLKNSLKISEIELEKVLYETPRPLLLSVIPTLIRRLENNFKIDENKEDLWVKGNFLPDFVTTPLFSDLTLPEISYVYDETTHSLGFYRGMKEYSPGRVSHYFQDKREDKKWVEINIDADEINISNYVVDYIDRSIEDKKILQPTKIKLTDAPFNVKNSSKSEYLWESHISEIGEGEVVHLKNDAISPFLNSFKFFTHSTDSPLKITRFTGEVKGNYEVKGSTDTKYFAKKLSLDGNQVYLGSSGEFDGIKINLNVKKLYEKLSIGINSKNFRAAYFNYLMESEETKLYKYLNSYFLRQRLAEVVQRSLISYSLLNECSIKDAHKNIFIDKKYLEENIDNMFSGYSEEIDDYSELSTELKIAINKDEIFSELKKISICLFDELLKNENYEIYLKERMISTFANSVHKSINDITDSVEELNIDVVDEDVDKVNIYISESSIGGVGTIDNLLQKINNDQNIILNLIFSNLEISDTERLDEDLKTIVLNINENTKLKDILNKVRNSSKSIKDFEFIKEIKKVLQELGLVTTDQLISTFLSRFGREGTTDKFDSLIIELLNFKELKESELDIEIDFDDLSYYAVKQYKATSILNLLNFSNNNSQLDIRTAISLLQSTFWVAGWRLRSNSLFAYNRFKKYLDPDRLLFKSILEKINVPQLEIISKKEISEKILDQEYFKNDTKYIVKVASKSFIKDVIIQLINKPIEEEYLEIFPVLNSIKKLEDNKYKIIFELPNI